MATQYYAGYGLCIQSTLPLPELIPASPGVADVTIRAGETGRTRPETDAAGQYFELCQDEAFLFWDRVGGFSVRGGREVIVETLPGVESSLMRLPLLGMVMGAVLLQRGVLALHGSAVSIDGQVAAIVGFSGRGKSTLAAALHARGHALVADDLLAVECPHEGAPRVHPSFPQLKLFPESALHSLGDDPDGLPLLATGIAKRGRRVANGFSLQPAPLRGIYVMQTEGAASLQRLPHGEALIELIRHSYAIRVFRRAMAGSRAVEHLQQCTVVANRVPVSRLTREGGLERVSELARRVEADLSAGHIAGTAGSRAEGVSRDDSPLVEGPLPTRSGEQSGRSATVAVGSGATCV